MPILQNPYIRNDELERRRLAAAQAPVNFPPPASSLQNEFQRGLAAAQIAPAPPPAFQQTPPLEVGPAPNEPRLPAPPQVAGVSPSVRAAAIRENRPLGRPGFLGGVAELGKSLVRGTGETIPMMAGESLKFGARLGLPPSLMAKGKELVKSAETFTQAHPEYKESALSRARAAESPYSVRGAAAQAGEMLPVSLGPVLAGAAAGAPFGPPGIAVGTAAGFISSLPLYFGSQAEETYQNLTQKGVGHAEAMRSGSVSGLIEAGGQAIADRVTFGLSRLLPARSLVKEGIVKAATKVLRNPMDMLKSLAKVSFAETGTEIAQAAGQQAVEGRYTGEPVNWRDVQSVIMPTLIMSTLMAGGTETIGGVRRSIVKRQLQDPDIDRKTREQAVNAVTKDVHRIDKNLAKRFHDDAMEQVAKNQPVILQDDQAYGALTSEEDAAKGPMTNAAEIAEAAPVPTPPPEAAPENKPPAAAAKPVAQPANVPRETPAQTPAEVAKEVAKAPATAAKQAIEGPPEAAAPEAAAPKPEAAAPKPEAPPAAPESIGPSKEELAKVSKDYTRPAYQKAREARLSERKVDTAQDDVLAAIAKGSNQKQGLNLDEAQAQGFDPANLSKRGYKIKRLFTHNGMNFDEAAEFLSQYGYPVTDDQGRPDANKVVDLVSRGLLGEKIYTPEGAEAQLARKADEREADEPERAAAMADLGYDLMSQELADEPLYNQSDTPHQRAYEDFLDARMRAEDVLGKDEAADIVERVSMDASDLSDEDFSSIITDEFNARIREKLHEQPKKVQTEPSVAGGRGGEGATEAPREGPAKPAESPAEAAPAREKPAEEVTRPKEKAEDLAGPKSEQAQALAEAKAEKEKKLTGEQIPPEEGEGGLFGAKQKQQDIYDVEGVAPAFLPSEQKKSAEIAEATPPPEATKDTEFEKRRAAFREKTAKHWHIELQPRLREFFDAFDAIGAERLEKARIKPEGMSATDWLIKLRSQKSTWDKGRKTGGTGIQYLSQKDLWPTGDAKGENLRKSMLKALRAANKAPGLNYEWMRGVEKNRDYDPFVETQERGKENAGRLRANERRLREAGNVPEGGAREGGENLEQPAPGQPGYGAPQEKEEAVRKPAETTNVTPEYARKRTAARKLAVPVQESDVNLQTATRAFSGTSHTPEKRAETVVQDYVSTMHDAYTKAEKQVKDDAGRQRLDEEFAKFKEGYTKRLNAYFNAHSRVISSLVSGPAQTIRQGLNAEKNMRSADARMNELSEWERKGRARLVEAAKVPIARTTAGELVRAQTNLAEREKQQQHMKDANKIFKKKGITDAERMKQLAALGINEQKAHQMMKPDSLGRIGYADFELKNNNAQIRRLRGRVEELRGRAAEGEAAGGARTIPFQGGAINVDYESGYVRVQHEEKPSAEVRQSLKAKGFHWSRNNQAWQRKLTDQAIADAQELTGAAAQELPKGGLKSRAQETQAANITDTNELKTELEKSVGTATLNRLLNNGTLKLVKEDSELPEGSEDRPGENLGKIAEIWHEKTNTTYMVANNIPKGNAYGLLLHGVGTHYAMPGMLGNKQWNNIKAQAEYLLKRGNEQLTKARAQVPKDVEQQYITEETIAYLVTDKQNHQMPFVRRILARLRAFLIRLGIRKNVTVDDLVALAQAGVRRASRGQVKARAEAGTGLEVGTGLLQARRPYENAPDSLMGFASPEKVAPYFKGFGENKYPHVEFVRLTWDNGQVSVDAIEGMNKPHALERARRNWPTANVESVTGADFDKFTLDNYPEDFASINSRKIIEDTANKRRNRGGLKARAQPANPQDRYLERNRRLREEHVTAFDKAKKWLKRQLAPGGLLPKTAFDLKLMRDFNLDVSEFDIAHLVGQLENAIKNDYRIRANKLSETTQELLSNALTDPASIDPSVPENTKKVLLAIRQHTDNLSWRLIGQYQQEVHQIMSGAGLKPSETDSLIQEYMNDYDVNEDHDAAKEAMLTAATEQFGKKKAKQVVNLFTGSRAFKQAFLVRTIESNIGKYMHTSYRAFDDKKWFKKIPNEVLNNARDYFVDRIMSAPENTMTQKQAEDKADVIMNEIVKTGTAYSDFHAFISESKLGAKDLSILMRKNQTLAPEIRALLGEYKDPRLNFARSATKMTRLLFNQAFLNNLRTAGMGNFLFTKDNKPPEATEMIAAESSEVYHPLNGLWTTPDVAQALKDAVGKDYMENWYRLVVQTNALEKFSKTVLSPTTAARNWISAFMFSMANGHFNMRHMNKALVGFSEYVSHMGREEKLAYLRELKELGVVYDTPYAGEMMRLFEDIRLSEGFMASPAGMTLQKGVNLAQKFYQFGDDFWKIIGFENEKEMLMGIGMPEQDAKIRAAQRIRSSYQTYSLAGRLPKMLSRFPLTGTFVLFPTEIIRTSFNILHLLAKDMKDPRMRPLVPRRIAGLAIASGMAYALQEASKAMLGFDDDDEEAVRLMAAPWQRNSNLAFTGRDAQGNIRFIDLSFMDPYNYWKRPINAIMRDQPWKEKAKDVLRETMTPFFGTDIAAGAIFEVLANKKESGAQVYNEFDEGPKQLMDISNHLRRTLQPGFVSNMERTWKALEGDTSPSGKKYSKFDEGLAWIGLRMSTLDPKVALKYRSFEFKDFKSAADRSVRKEILQNQKATRDDIVDAYKTTMRMRTRAFDNMTLLAKAASRSGLSNRQIIAALRSANVTKRDIASIMRGQVPPYMPTVSTIRQQARSAAVAFGPDAGRRVLRHYLELRRYLIQQQKAGG